MEHFFENELSDDEDPEYYYDELCEMISNDRHTLRPKNNIAIGFGFQIRNEEHVRHKIAEIFERSDDSRSDLLYRHALLYIGQKILDFDSDYSYSGYRFEFCNYLMKYIFIDIMYDYESDYIECYIYFVSYTDRSLAQMEMGS